MPDRQLTVDAQTVDPFLHVDERALVMSDGRHTVLLDAARLRFAADTLDVIAAEGRATRAQHAVTFGGFELGDGRTVLYLANEHAAVSLSVERDALNAVREHLPRAP